MTFMKYGLIGKNLSHSFSQEFFNNKFNKEGLSNCRYDNYELSVASDLSDFLENTDCVGLNVTLPYKEDVIACLDQLDDNAEKIGAVNTILIKEGIKKGYNTDYLGFQRSLKHQMDNRKVKALILGTGGSSKAVSYALELMNIPYQFVSRSNSNKTIGYSDMDKKCMEEHPLIINCTPIGMWPNTEDTPPIPFKFLNENHLVFDLIYNPEKTRLLELAELKGAAIVNGLEMLEIQAEESWKIWNS